MATSPLSAIKRASRPRSLVPGMRVRLRSANHLVDLRSPLGRIVRPDEYDDYYIVRLDAPAIYHNADGTTSELAEIAEMVHNLEVIPRSTRHKVSLHWLRDVREAVMDTIGAIIELGSRRLR